MNKEEQLTEEKEERKKTKQSRALRALLACILALLFLVLGFVAGWFGYYGALGERNRSLIWSIDTLKKNYYLEIDEDELYEKLFSVFEVDPYSCYYTREEYQSVTQKQQGTNRGYGFSLSNIEAEDFPRVHSVVENSPAQNGGLKKGMYLYAYGGDGENWEEGDSSQFLSFAAQCEGELYLKCGFSKDRSDSKTVQIKAASYPAAYCSYRDSETSFGFRGESKAQLTETYEPLSSLPKDTAYIRIDEFNGNAAWEFETLLNTMHGRGRTNLILDLRSNGGGLLSIFLQIASHLTKTAGKGENVLAKAMKRDGEEILYTSSRCDYDKYFNEDSQIKILADEYTASASECLIGAMHDYGTVSYKDIFLRKSEGETARTYGKGIMQSSFTDWDGNVLKMTVAKIYWPSGRCIHKTDDFKGGVSEDDGAKGVLSPVLWGEEDVLLKAAVSSLN